MRNPHRSDPYYQKIDALADEGAHRTYCHTVEQVPRVYEGRCFECDWHGSETTGTKALQEMLAHTESTHPSRLRRKPAQSGPEWSESRFVPKARARLSDTT